MRKTHFSMYYLAGYLLPTGLLLMINPTLVFKLLFSNGSYGEVLPRFVGMLLFGIGMIIVQVIRHHIEALYPTTLLVRIFFSVGLIGFYLQTRDPFFLAVLAVVSFGLLLTGASYLSERGK